MSGNESFMFDNIISEIAYFLVSSLKQTLSDSFLVNCRGIVTKLIDLRLKGDEQGR